MVPMAQPSQTSHTTFPADVRTLAIDIGGTGLKASVLDANGEEVVPRERVPTPYPCPPKVMVEALKQLVDRLPEFHRIAAGFPGMVRAGVVYSAPNLSAEAGPGTPTDPDVAAAWDHFDLAGALADAFDKPARVANDADVQGFAAITGKGLEVVLTLGTGFGSAVFENGRLCPHLEISHQPFRNGETYDEQLGDVARKDVGAKRWNRRVERAIENMRELFFFDHLYIGGGNAKKLTIDLPDDISRVDNTAGVLGGIGLWDGVPGG
jgi:polyphosphate glucokinase